MNLHDLTTIAATVLLSIGGGGVIVLGLANWIGKILANKYVEKLKHEIQQELESHKTRLRKSEFLFQKEFEAASTFISLHRGLLPRYRLPEMEWREACADFALSFDHVEKTLESYIASHGAALKRDTLERLASAKTKAAWGKLDVHPNSEVSSREVQLAEEVMTTLQEVENELCQAVRSQSDT